jgi:hypothetical protein
MAKFFNEMTAEPPAQQIRRASIIANSITG